MRILIVDDDPLVCKSLEILLSKEKGMEIVGVAQNGSEALQRCEETTVDVVLMDIRMPKMDGIKATREIKKLRPKTRVMMLTTFQDEESIRLALLAGAEGYLLKSGDIESMANQVRALSSGRSVLEKSVFDQLVMRKEFDLKTLTPREKDIAELVAQGLSNKEIAEELYIGEGTVRNNLSTILDKLALRDRTQIAIHYWRGK